MRVKRILLLLRELDQRQQANQEIIDRFAQNPSGHGQTVRAREAFLNALSESVQLGEEKMALASQARALAEEHVTRIDRDMATYQQQLEAEGKFPRDAKRLESPLTNRYAQQKAIAAAALTAASPISEGSSPAPAPLPSLPSPLVPPVPLPQGSVLTVPTAGVAAVPIDSTIPIDSALPIASVPPGAAPAAGAGTGAGAAPPATPALPAAAGGDPAVAATPEAEAVYCFCGKKRDEAMVACDNEECPYQWFHFSCVGLKAEPPQNQKWYCPQCAPKMKTR